MCLWQYDGSTWSELSQPNSVDTDANEVSANVTSSGIVAILGEPVGDIEVNISIKPPDDPNAINPNDEGVVPVAICNDSADYVVQNVNVSSLRFGAPGIVENGGGAAPVHDGQFEDVDDDGDLDLVVHFPIQDAGFDDGDTEGMLAGELDDGTSIEGTDSAKLAGRPD